MSLFAESTNNRDRIVNKHAQKFNKRMMKDIKKIVRMGGLYTSLRLEDVRVYGLPIGMEEEVYERSLAYLNDYYKGEVKIEISPYGSRNEFKMMEATVVKV